MCGGHQGLSVDRQLCRKTSTPRLPGGTERDVEPRPVHDQKASAGPGWFVGRILQRRPDEFHYVGMENGPSNVRFGS